MQRATSDISLFPSNVLVSNDCPRAERRWWAVYSLARQEKAIARSLVGHNIPFYLPLVPKVRTHRGRRVRSHIPLFPGYLFLFANSEERVTALTTNRISRIYTVDDQDGLQRELQQVQRLIASDLPLTVERRLVPGQQVRVKAGLLKGLEGIVVCRRQLTRLLVAVNFLQQGASIEIDDYLLEPLR
jgi:transcription antitermination factor NusG